jgi:(p)ppGpp synthase/HD superfamily hydrolase
MDDLVQKAEPIARKAHEGQMRWDKTPYVAHPEALAATFGDPVFKAVAWLHDTIEDTDITAQDLSDAGMPPEVVAAVVALTHERDVPYLDYILEIKKNPIAEAVKMADLRHNSSDLHKYKGKKDKKDKYAMALYILGQ